MRGGSDQELFIQSGMIHIVGHGRDQGGHLFQRPQVLAENGLLDEAGHGLRHVGRVHPVVVRVGAVVVLLDGGEELPYQQAIQAKVSTKTEVLEQVRAQGGEVLAFGQPVEGKCVEIPVGVNAGEDVLGRDVIVIQEVPPAPESHQALGSFPLAWVGSA